MNVLEGNIQPILFCPNIRQTQGEDLLPSFLLPSWKDGALHVLFGASTDSSPLKVHAGKTGNYKTDAYPCCSYFIFLKFLPDNDTFIAIWIR
jgi:hypothetical protein